MVGLPGIGKGGRCHGHFQQAQHIVEFPHPLQPVVLFRQGQMQGVPRSISCTDSISSAERVRMRLSAYKSKSSPE